MYERILVPLDGSSAAEIVLPYTEELASKFGAEIILVIVSEHAVDERDHLYRTYLERITEQVKLQLEGWGARGKAKLKSEVLVGRPASEILRYADKNNVSIITMASRGFSGQGPWLLGNIAAKVLRAINLPVLLIRSSPENATLQRTRLIRRILVPLDGSVTGEAAIPQAETLARALGAELILFHAVEPLTGFIGSEAYAMYPENEGQRSEAAAGYLDRVEKGLHKKGLRTSSAVDLGSASDKILEYAEANAIDLIAMSTHGRSGIGRWVFGCVTDKVLHAGDTPVLTVQAPRA
ncbi:MAG: universal stress protein [Desulfobacteraceae bacterium]|nr:MAG: universal stress protein [Desulfobacteraceae bacterium]